MFGHEWSCVKKETPRIAVVGSLNMDLVVSAAAFPRKGETITGHAIHYIPGGKGANQAVACARLGAMVSMIGAVGDDQFGRRLREVLEQEGVDVSAVATLPGVATGVASIIHAEQDNRIIVVPGANGEVTPELIERHREQITAADVLLVQLEIPLPAVESALRIAREEGVTTILNPAPVQHLPASLLSLVDYITPNELEFQILASKADSQGNFGQANSNSHAREKQRTDSDNAEQQLAVELEQNLQAWSEAAAPAIVLTLGSKGALLCKAGEVSAAAAPQVQVVDTTGAGDCLNGAFATCLAKGMSPQQALQLAVKAATISVTVFGAQAGMPTWEQLDVDI